jgi:hypothetical protein
MDSMLLFLMITVSQPPALLIYLWTEGMRDWTSDWLTRSSRWPPYVVACLTQYLRPAFPPVTIIWVFLYIYCPQGQAKTHFFTSSVTPPYWPAWNKACFNDHLVTSAQSWTPCLRCRRHKDTNNPSIILKKNLDLRFLWRPSQSRHLSCCTYYKAYNTFTRCRHERYVFKWI